MIGLASVFRRLTKSDPLGGLVRYETSIERSFYRAVHNLERAQARRKGEMVAAPIAVDIGVERYETRPDGNTSLPKPRADSETGCFASSYRVK